MRFIDVHEQGAKVIRLDRDVLKPFIAFRHGLKGEADDRAVNTQFDGCVFHSDDVARQYELDVVVDVLSWLALYHLK